MAGQTPRGLPFPTGTDTVVKIPQFMWDLGIALDQRIRAGKGGLQALSGTATTDANAQIRLDFTQLATVVGAQIQAVSGGAVVWQWNGATGQSAYLRCVNPNNMQPLPNRTVTYKALGWGTNPAVELDERTTSAGGFPVPTATDLWKNTPAELQAFVNTASTRFADFTVTTFSGLLSLNGAGEVRVYFDLNRVDGLVINSGPSASGPTRMDEWADTFCWDYRQDAEKTSVILTAYNPHNSTRAPAAAVPVNIVAWGAGGGVALPAPPTTTPNYEHCDWIQRLAEACDEQLGRAGSVTFGKVTGTHSVIYSPYANLTTVGVPGLSRVDGAIVSLQANGAVPYVMQGGGTTGSQLQFRALQTVTIPKYGAPPPGGGIAPLNFPWGATPMWPRTENMWHTALAWGA